MVTYFLFQINAGNKGLYYEGSLQSLPRGVGGGGYVDRMKGKLFIYLLITFGAWLIQ